MCSCTPSICFLFFSVKSCRFPDTQWSIHFEWHLWRKPPKRTPLDQIRDSCSAENTMWQSASENGSCLGVVSRLDTPENIKTSRSTSEHLDPADVDSSPPFDRILTALSSLLLPVYQSSYNACRRELFSAGKAGTWIRISSGTVERDARLKAETDGLDRIILDAPFELSLKSKPPEHSTNRNSHFNGVFSLYLKLNRSIHGLPRSPKSPAGNVLPPQLSIPTIAGGEQMLKFRIGFNLSRRSIRFLVSFRRIEHGFRARKKYIEALKEALFLERCASIVCSVCSSRVESILRSSLASC